ncbi:MAG: DUF2243 domain-containing protein [Gemmatimonadota bacterium]
MRRILDRTVPVRRRAGIVIGIGLGGFADGILFHQIERWHDMGSSVLRPTTVMAVGQNMMWYGLFDAAMWMLTLAGVIMLRSDAARGQGVPSARMFTGQLITGWGLFNLLEGVIAHHTASLPHVKNAPIHISILASLFLLVAGLGLIAIGLVITRREPTRAPARAL